MSTHLMFVVVALAIVIGLFNLVLSFGLIGRVRVLQDAVQAGFLRNPDLPAPGTAVGAFQVTTEDGTQLSEAAIQGDPALICFMTPGCRPCAELRAQLLASPPALRMIAFVEGTREDPEVRQIVDSLRGLGAVATIHEDDAVTRAFKPAGFPTLIRTANGNIAAAGHRLSQVL
jgi:hypothetical protein